MYLVVYGVYRPRFVKNIQNFRLLDKESKEHVFQELLLVQLQHLLAVGAL